MKASTLFAITIALLVGLVAVGAAKMFHLFDRQPTPPPREQPKVLVAGQNLFEGIVLTGKEVRLRPARESELSDLQAGKLMPPVPESVNMRVLKHSVEADSVLRRDDFEPLELPEAVNRRLKGDLRAV